MSDLTILIDGTQAPRFLYGTAWKEGDTQRLTEVSLREGFRGIDTANQRRHYDEAAVGRAISEAIRNGLVARDDLFLQTKFTFRAGQDHRLPYDPKASISVQVEQSFAKSLEHLGVEWIDSYMLHGPTTRNGLTPDDWAAWQSMERLHDSGLARMLGVSNVSLEQLQRLCDGARIRPRIVQNRCYAALGWDREIRAFCASAGIIYQGFSLLTANRKALAHPGLIQIAKRRAWTVSQVVFRFALDVGMMPLTGTTDARHMKEDLDVLSSRLDADEVRQIEGLAAS
jgi:diketogulonate reductase-like aldo/keto reductase